MIRLRFDPGGWVVGLRYRSTPGMRYRRPSAPVACLALAGTANFRPARPIDTRIAEPAELIEIDFHVIPCVAIALRFVRGLPNEGQGR